MASEISIKKINIDVLINRKKEARLFTLFPQAGQIRAIETQS